MQADGEVRLEGARIGGTLNFNGARLYNPGGRALTAEGITIGQPMYCGRGFQANGEVGLVGGHISGVLDLNQARLCNPDGVALAADYLSVDHDLLCSDRFQTDGAVYLRDAHLGGLSDSKETWPRQLVIDGLTYDHLTAHPDVSAKERLDWLRNDLDRYIPQPYEQLATVYPRISGPAR